jgi:alginate O-acetyltransferase complex protein AlgI
VVVVLGLAVSVVPGESFASARVRFSRLPLAVQGVFFAVLLVALDALGPRGVAPFIYFQF